MFSADGVVNERAGAVDELIQLWAVLTNGFDTRVCQCTLRCAEHNAIDDNFRQVRVGKFLPAPV